MLLCHKCIAYCFASHRYNKTLSDKESVFVFIIVFIISYIHKRIQEKA